MKAELKKLAVVPSDNKNTFNKSSSGNTYKKSGYIPTGTVSSTMVSGETNQPNSYNGTLNYSEFIVLSRPYDNDSHKQPKKKKKDFHINPYMNYSEEEDSDMDEPIQGTNVNYSKMIRKITKYDPRNFKNESEYDLAMMENKSFKSIQKEESRSLQMAKQEDAIDI